MKTKIFYLLRVLLIAFVAMVAGTVNVMAQDIPAPVIVPGTQTFDGSIDVTIDYDKAYTCWYTTPESGYNTIYRGETLTFTETTTLTAWQSAHGDYSDISEVVSATFTKLPPEKISLPSARRALPLSMPTRSV